MPLLVVRPFQPCPRSSRAVASVCVSKIHYGTPGLTACLQICPTSAPVVVSLVVSDHGSALLAPKPACIVFPRCAALYDQNQATLAWGSFPARGTHRVARPDRAVIAWIPEQPRLRVFVLLGSLAQRRWFRRLIECPLTDLWEISFVHWCQL
jgi:hypothetical protein